MKLSSFLSDFFLENLRLSLLLIIHPRQFEYANSIGAATVAFCVFSGGKIKQIASLAVHADIDNMEIVEGLHVVIAHCVKNIIITEFKVGTTQDLPNVNSRLPAWPPPVPQVS